MLTGVRAWLSEHLIAMKEACVRVWRSPVASFMTILSIACILMLSCVFLMFANNLHAWKDHVTTENTLNLYLQVSTSSSDQQRLLADILRMQGVQTAILKTPSDGLQELSQQEGMQDIVKDLTENPLPPVIEVRLEQKVMTGSTLYQQLSVLPHVEQIKSDTEWLSRFDSISSFMALLARVLTICFGLSVMFIVANALHQMVASHYEDIRLFQVIGAQERYILRPFLYVGVLYGMCGAIVACLATWLFSSILIRAFNPLMNAFSVEYTWLSLTSLQLCLLCVLSVGLSWIATCLSVKRQLFSLDKQS